MNLSDLKAEPEVQENQYSSRLAAYSHVFIWVILYDRDKDRAKQHFGLFSKPIEKIQLLQNTVALKGSQLHCVPGVLFVQQGVI